MKHVFILEIWTNILTGARFFDSFVYSICILKSEYSYDTIIDNHYYFGERCPGCPAVWAYLRSIVNVMYHGGRVSNLAT